MITTINKFRSMFLLTRSGFNTNTKNRLNTEKESIKLMLRESTIKLDARSLKKIKNYGTSIASKLFGGKDVICSLGDLAILHNDLKFSTFEILYSFEKTVNTMQKFWEKEDIDFNLLHDPEKLDKTLKLFTFLSQNAKWTLSRFFLTYLAYYIQESKLIQNSEIESILCYLSERRYCTYFIEDYIKKNYGDQPVITDTSATKLQDFVLIAQRIKTLENYKKAMEKGELQNNLIENIDEMLKRYKGEYLQALKSPIMIQDIMTIEPEVWVQDWMFSPQYKDGTLKMLVEMFEPMNIYAVQFHKNIFRVIFDKLLVHTNREDYEQMFKVLEKFKEYICIFGNSIKVEITPSIIFLCSKFNYISKTLANYIYENYLHQKFLIKSLSFPLSHKKNKLNNKNMVMEACHLLAECEVISGEIQPEWRSLFTTKLQNVLDLNLHEFPGIQAYIFQDDFVQVRHRVNPEDLTTQFYRLMGQFYLKQDGLLQQNLLRIQRHIGASYKSSFLERLTYPITSKFNMAARMNILFWNLYYYSKINSNREKAEKIYMHINSNQIIIRQLQSKIGYPKLFEALIKFMLMMADQNKGLLTLKGSNHLTILIQQEKHRFNTIFFERVQQNVEKLDKSVNKYYLPFIEYLSNPLCSTVKDYSRDEQIEQNIQSLLFSEIYTGKIALKQKVMNQMRQFFTKNPRYLNKLKVTNNHVDFPYLSDFLILFRGKALTIFIVDSSNESIKEESIQHFQKNSITIIVRTEEDIRNIFKSLNIAETSH